jgi:hypothetical protein
MATEGTEYHFSLKDNSLWKIKALTWFCTFLNIKNCEDKADYTLNINCTVTKNPTS